MIEFGKLYFIAEIGQNHQGDINIAKKMVDQLVGTGVSAIKTAKRDIDTCLSEEQKKNALSK
jgi:sialic acid synthase SpsE